MSIPDYEHISAAIATALTGISVAAGYHFDVQPAAVVRRDLLPTDVEAANLWPAICVLRDPNGGERSKATNVDSYKAWLPLLLSCYLMADQSIGQLPDTEANYLQNDIQSRLWAAHEAGTLRTVRGIDLDFPAEPVVFEETGATLPVIVRMLYQVRVCYLLPKRGY